MLKQKEQESEQKVYDDLKQDVEENKIFSLDHESARENIQTVITT